VAGVALGHRDDQAQVGLQQVGLGRLAVGGEDLVVALLGGREALLLREQPLGVEPGLDSLGEIYLLRCIEQGRLGDLV